MHIPYKGGAPALQALLAGEVQALFGETSTAMPWLRSGRARALAVVADQRLPLLPNVPTLAELGIADAPTDAWMALAGPRGLPGTVVKRLSQALARAVGEPEFRRLLVQAGGEAAWSTPEDLQSLWAKDQRRWSSVIRAHQLRAE